MLFYLPTLLLLKHLPTVCPDCFLLSILRSLDEEQLPDLIEILQSLLRDHSPMVLGSALMAFNEICPNQFELLHPHFRKICHLLADVDEWGQVMILNTLTRYARTQFTNPEGPEKVRPLSPILEKFN